MVRLRPSFRDGSNAPSTDRIRACTAEFTWGGLGKSTLTCSSEPVQNPILMLVLTASKVYNHFRHSLPRPTHHVRNDTAKPLYLLSNRFHPERSKWYKFLIYLPFMVSNLPFMEMFTQLGRDVAMYNLVYPNLSTIRTESKSSNVF